MEVWQLRSVNISACWFYWFLSLLLLRRHQCIYFYLIFIYFCVAKNNQIYIYNNKSIEKHVFFIPWFHRTTWSRLTLPRLFFETGSIPNPAAFPFVSQTFDGWCYSSKGLWLSNPPGKDNWCAVGAPTQYSLPLISMSIDSISAIM